MPEDWERTLARWAAADLIDAPGAARIRAYEAQHAKPRRLRWPVLVALVFGALMLGAGLLLFVSAHWDMLSPGVRFALVLAMVALLHVGGAFSGAGFRGLSMSLHTVGTIALGAGIALAGQIFNLQQHWPRGTMLWTLGAVLGWVMLRHWTQGALVAVLLPAWLAGEWFVAAAGLTQGADRPMAEGLLLLAVSYLSARPSRDAPPLRRALGWIGGLALLPCTLGVIVAGSESIQSGVGMPGGLLVSGWLVAIALPLAVAVWTRGQSAWVNVVTAIWVVVLGMVSRHGDSLPVYAWCALGSIGLVAWGVREGRSERINLGVAAFALTVLVFYSSSVMDRLGRSVSLIGLGLLFLAGGWVLEWVRRHLVARATIA